MKITGVTANNRKRVFEVETRRGAYVMPYAKVDPAPSSRAPISEVYVDPELGREGFTYVLQSGEKGSVHVDSVLEYNEDPSYMVNLALYELTIEARRRFDQSGLSAREVARWLGTSPAQLYRLLDPTNYSKSVKQLTLLLYVLGFQVELAVRKRSDTNPRHRARTRPDGGERRLRRSGSAPYRASPKITRAFGAEFPNVRACRKGSASGIAEAIWRCGRYIGAVPSVQVKDVPSETHAVLRQRAAAAGQSLQEYLRQRLIEEAATPTVEEVLERAGGRAGGSVPFAEAVAALREDRDRR